MASPLAVTSESRSALARWALLLALTAGMVLMHHVPGGHGHDSGAPSATASTAGGAGQHHPARGAPSAAEHADGQHPDAERSDRQRSDRQHSDRQHSDPGQHGPVQLDDLLHLCLAIIAGAALLLLDRQRNRAALTGSNPGRRTAPRPRDRRRRPPPMRRRLAELCVLRL